MGLSVSGDEFIRNMLAQIYIGHMIMLAQMLLFIPVPSISIKYVKNTYVWEVSGWCLWVSGSYLGVSGRCLGQYRCHKNHKQLNRSRHIKLLPFLPVASD